jgi:oxygen-independent coproporphyrinogen-3 oxidase
MAGIYIHIPFCKSRCRYCDFFSTTQLEKQQSYVQALLCEWESRNGELQEDVTTLYIGGGTPSTLPIHLLQDITTAIASPRLSEFTLEVNPGDITTELLYAWRKMGINRLSIGVQTFNDNLLQLIGRRHTSQQAIEAVLLAQAAGFDNISIDLMYALPTQTMDMWQEDVEQALQLGVQHISSYGLIYEEGTALTQMLEAGDIQVIDEDLEMAMYDYLVTTLTQQHFVHYEVSNFALPGYESKHNSSYWQNIPYIGLGAAAHSYDGATRQWNINDMDLYIQQALAHQLQPEFEHLNSQQLHTERIMLGLRTKQGVDIELVNLSKAQPYIEQAMLTIHGNKLVATTQGFHILNRIIEDLI